MYTRQVMRILLVIYKNATHSIEKTVNDRIKNNYLFTYI